MNSARRRCGVAILAPFTDSPFLLPGTLPRPCTQEDDPLIPAMGLYHSHDILTVPTLIDQPPRVSASSVSVAKTKRPAFVLVYLAGVDDRPSTDEMTSVHYAQSMKPAARATVMMTMCGMRLIGVCLQLTIGQRQVVALQQVHSRTVDYTAGSGHARTAGLCAIISFTV